MTTTLCFWLGAKWKSYVFCVFVQKRDNIPYFVKLSEKNVETKFKNYGNFIYRMKLNSIPVNIDELKGKYGFFYEAQIKSMENMTNFINSKYQTLTYFGFQKEELENFVIQNRPSGIDRIVPVGQALDIDIIWDGYDLAKSLSRIIDVR